jgi:hypothetical protein
MLIPLKTPAAARSIGTTYHRLMGLIRFAKLDPAPDRDSSGHFVWSPEDLDRARQALQIDMRRHKARQGVADHV